MHSYSIQLRIFGSELDPEYVTNFLAIRPDLIRLKGDARGRNGTWEESLWSYGGGEVGAPEWAGLEEGLLELMRQLWAKKDLICLLAQKFEVIWWCGHFQSSFDGGPIFSVELMRKLTEFGVPLYLDNYFYSENETSGDAGRE